MPGMNFTKHTNTALQVQVFRQPGSWGTKSPPKGPVSNINRPTGKGPDIVGHLGGQRQDQKLKVITFWYMAGSKPIWDESCLKNKRQTYRVVI